MSLYEQITRDRDDARRSGQAARRNTLGYLLAEAKALAKKTHKDRDPSDDEVLQTIRRLVRQNDETVRESRREDPEVVNDTAILLGYLPTQMPETELAEIIAAIIAGLDDPKSPKALGQVMATLKQRHAGSYDAALAAQITKIQLA